MNSQIIQAFDKGFINGSIDVKEKQNCLMPKLIFIVLFTRSKLQLILNVWVAPFPH
jgi:hypothetical protein